LTGWVLRFPDDLDIVGVDCPEAIAAYVATGEERTSRFAR
jgi:hypothetical protein